GGGAITVADGATLGLKVSGANTTFNTSALTLGTSTGATLQVDLGTFGSPTAAVINAPILLRSGTTTIKILGSGFNGSTFKLVDYTTTSGAGTITLSLPFRVTGTAVNNAVT